MEGDWMKRMLKDKYEDLMASAPIDAAQARRPADDAPRP